MSRLKEINMYLSSISNTKEYELEEMERLPFYLSFMIMLYAHRNQNRENGENYGNHPSRCQKEFCRLIGLDDDETLIYRNLMQEYDIPCDGVQEVCFLHDVIEDCDFTIDDIEEIFVECGLGTHFNLYIKQALINITHNESIDYSLYIKICMENPISAIVKMMDLQDNLCALSLAKFDEKNYKRSIKYLGYLYQINSKYRFIEKANQYRKAVSELKKKHKLDNDIKKPIN